MRSWLRCVHLGGSVSTRAVVLHVAILLRLRDRHVVSPRQRVRRQNALQSHARAGWMLDSHCRAGRLLSGSTAPLSPLLPLRRSGETLGSSAVVRLLREGRGVKWAGRWPRPVPDVLPTYTALLLYFVTESLRRPSLPVALNVLLTAKAVGNMLNVLGRRPTRLGRKHIVRTVT